MKFYELDGKPFERAGVIPPIGLVPPEEHSEEMCQGWYFQDEAEQSNGPFNTFEEAVEALKRYGEQL